MAKIIAIDGRVRAANRRLVTNALGAPCCCPSARSFRLFYNCCDLGNAVPILAVSEAVVLHLQATCESGVDLVVRLGGRADCFSPGSQTQNVTREQAESMGLVIVDDAARLTCQATDESFPVDRCYTQTCPECPGECCLLNYFRHQCPDARVVIIDNGVPDRKRNRCCNYGREAEAIWTHSRREVVEGYTSFQYYEPTNGCGPGCYDELLAFRTRRQTYQRYHNRFRACDADGTTPDRVIDCISGEFYTRIEQTTRRRDNLDNCLAYVDDVNDNESRSTDCWTDLASGYPISPLFPRRPSRSNVRNYDGTIWVNIEPETGSVTNDLDGTVCEDVSNFRSIQRQLLDRDQYTETEWLTTFRYGVDCSGGSYLFDQMATTRVYGLGCPRDGAILGRVHIVTQSSYSIRITARDNCDPASCNGFQRPEPTGPALPFSPEPVPGALEFL